MEDRETDRDQSLRSVHHPDHMQKDTIYLTNASPFPPWPVSQDFFLNQKKDRKKFPLSEDRKIELERESDEERSEYRGGDRRISIAWLSGFATMINHRASKKDLIKLGRMRRRVL